MLELSETVRGTDKERSARQNKHLFYFAFMPGLHRKMQARTAETFLELTAL